MLVDPDVYGDARGYFLETWNQRRYADLGLHADFVQDNISFSRRGILRGLHFQNPLPQGKLVMVLEGEVFDVAVDLRLASPTFGRWQSVVLSSENRRQCYIPPGFAHGFQVTSEAALFSYKCTEFYAPGSETILRWDDPDLGIPWPLPDPIISAKDSAGVRLADLPRGKLYLNKPAHAGLMHCVP